MLVSHRLSTINVEDIVYEMENERSVVETGTIESYQKGHPISGDISK
ncbi:MAG: hypothetical protein ACLTSZ_11755 [Lachnospiraceae bacterium]